MDEHRQGMYINGTPEWVDSPYSMIKKGDMLAILTIGLKTLKGLNTKNLLQLADDHGSFIIKLREGYK
jgi:hypothetical protein